MRSALLRVVFGTALAIGLTGGCSTSRVNKAGARVQVVDGATVAHCQSIGPVSGSGGGSFGGAWISNNDLVQYAINDLRNEAAARRATHVVVSSTNMAANQSGSTTTAIVTGNAYQCTEADLSAPPAASMPAPTASAAPEAGHELGPCYGNGTCNDGLQCASGLCVNLPPASPPPSGE